jgi:hypothetical protein
MGGERPYKGKGRKRTRHGGVYASSCVLQTRGGGGEEGMKQGQERGRTGKGRGTKEVRGGRWGQRPDEDGEMERRGLLGALRVSKSDPFSSNNRLSISRTFPGTPPNIHILPFPDFLAQTPVPIIPLSGSRTRHSGAHCTAHHHPPTPHTTVLWLFIITRRFRLLHDLTLLSLLEN